MPPSLTHEATARLSEPTLRYSRVSKPEASTSSRPVARAGSTSSHPCCGQSAPRQPSPPAKHRSSSSTGRKQFSPPSSNMGPRGSSHSTRLAKTTYGKTTWCSSRRPVTRPPSAQPGISKDYAATTAATSAPVRSKLVILSFEESSPGKASTSSHPCGKDRLGSCTFHDLAQHGWRCQMVSRCRTRGTSTDISSPRGYPEASHQRRHEAT